MDDKPPPTDKNSILLYARWISASYSKVAALFRLWADTPSNSTVHSLRGVGRSGRISILVDF